MIAHLQSLPMELPRARLLCEDCGVAHRSNEACFDPTPEQEREIEAAIQDWREGNV